jgi:predicted DNA-binding helix-hairpin-helix protein
MKQLKEGIIQSKNELAIYKNAPVFAPAGQATQMVIGASADSDKQIVTLSESLYRNYRMKRVFYSAYVPVNERNSLLPREHTPRLREHRLYQCDFLLRFYKFNAQELFNKNENLDLNMDPKCQWALQNLEYFPVEVNKADRNTLLRVPGIGQISADRILAARKLCNLTFDNLKKMGVVLKRAKYFITCSGKAYYRDEYSETALKIRLSEYKIGEGFEQVSVADALKIGTELAVINV